MNALANEWWIAAIAILVAMNPISTAPIYLAMTDGMSTDQRKGLIRDATALAAVVSLAICWIGNAMLSAIGVTIGDLRIAGGLTLIGLGFHDLVLSRQIRKTRHTVDIGAVPIGVPLMVGPATMTTLIIGAEESGYILTTLALLPNLVLSWFVMTNAHRMIPLIGDSGAKAFGKFMSLILMAIGVAMVRATVMALAG